MSSTGVHHLLLSQKLVRRVISDPGQASAAKLRVLSGRSLRKARRLGVAHVRDWLSQLGERSSC